MGCALATMPLYNEAIMNTFKITTISFIMASVIVTIDQICIHFFIEEECKHLLEHIITVIALSSMVAIVAFFLSNWALKVEQKKRDNELKETRIASTINIIHKIQDTLGNFQQSLLIIDLDLEENGIISISTREAINARIKEVYNIIAELAEVK